MSKIYNFFTSIKLTVVLLLLLAITSIVGTVIPQDWQPFQYQQQFGDSGYAIIKFFSLIDMYHSWWFQVLLSILVVNLLVCTIRRFPKTLKILKPKNPYIEPQRLQKMRTHHVFESPLLVDNAWGELQLLLKKHFHKFQVLDQGEEKALVAEKGRYSRLAVYLIHLSILFIFAGALIGSFLGFNGFMNLDEKENSATVLSFGDKRTIELPFQVRCDKFLVSFYKTGQPKDYISKLSILRDGKIVHKKNIKVNDPLRYHGIAFFQANYGVHLKGARVELTETKTGKKQKITLSPHNASDIAGSESKLQLMDFQENFYGFGPALGIALFEPGQKPEGAWILSKFPNFHGNRLGTYKITVDSISKIYYTGLQVKKDPGVWVVWTGCILLMLGIAATFYTSHRRLWVRVERANPGTIIYMAGNCSKNRSGFSKEFASLVQELEKKLKKEILE